MVTEHVGEDLTGTSAELVEGLARRSVVPGALSDAALHEPLADRVTILNLQALGARRRCVGDSGVRDIIAGVHGRGATVGAAGHPGFGEGRLGVGRTATARARVERLLGAIVTAQEQSADPCPE